MTTYSVVNGHAEKVMECPKGGEHEWISPESFLTDKKIEGSLSNNPVWKRFCKKCKHRQFWIQKTLPTPENAPKLGFWE